MTDLDAFHVFAKSIADPNCLQCKGEGLVPSPYLKIRGGTGPLDVACDCTAAKPLHMEPAKLVMNTCQGCVFHKRQNEFGGVCYRYPPTAAFQVLSDDRNFHFENLRPWTANDEWCGEYKPRFG